MQHDRSRIVSEATLPAKSPGPDTSQGWARARDQGTCPAAPQKLELNCLCWSSPAKETSVERRQEAANDCSLACHQREAKMTLKDERRNVVSFWRQRSRRNQTGRKVTFSTGLEGAKCIMGKLLYGCVLTSLAVSRASTLIPLLLLCGRKGWIAPSSKSLFHLPPITPSSGGGGEAKERHKQTVSAFYTSFSSLVPLLLLLIPLSPPHIFSGTLLVLHDPRAQEFLQFPVSAHTLFKLTLFSCLPPVL